MIRHTCIDKKYIVKVDYREDEDICSQTLLMEIFWTQILKIYAKSHIFKEAATNPRDKWSYNAPSPTPPPPHGGLMTDHLFHFGLRPLCTMGFQSSAVQYNANVRTPVKSICHWRRQLHISLQLMQYLFPDCNRATYCNNKPTRKKLGELITQTIRKATLKSKILKNMSKYRDSIFLVMSASR